MAPRDYKPANSDAPRRRQPRPARKPATGPAPRRLTWFVLGAVVGIGGTLAVYEQELSPEILGAAARAWLAGDRVRTHPVPAPAADAPAKPRFEFYTLLPEMEVAVPEEELVRAHNAQTSEAAPATTPGGRASARDGATKPAVPYVLQAGSFRRKAEAERLKASLALLGLQASIQTVTGTDDETWHRVRVGPYTDVRRLNEARARLRSNKVESIVVRIKG